MDTVLFVCSGNTCRSPMAEAIARDRLAHGLLGQEGQVFVASAGVFAPDGLPPTQEALAALAAGGVQHEGRSKPLKPERVTKATRGICMTDAHRAAIDDLMGGDEAQMAKVVLLDPDGDVAQSKADVGYEPEFTLDSAVADYIGWLRAGNEQ